MTKEKQIEELEKKHKEEIEILEGKIKTGDEALKSKDLEIKKLDSEIKELSGQISEFEKTSVEAASKKKSAKVQYIGLITSIRHDGKVIPEGAKKEDVPKELQEKFSKYFQMIEK